MKENEVSREVFLADCEILSDSWSKEDDRNLKDFLETETGRRVLGKLQLMWKAVTVSTLAINCRDPYAAAAELSSRQGEIRATIRCIDRLMEMEPPNVSS